jgi:large subunit ribosomal protein L31
MKQNIHPKWNSQTTVTCSCGNTFTTGSVLDAIQVEVCSLCHPFYTGKMKFIDLQGRVDRFINKRAAAQKTVYVSKKKKKSEKKEDHVSLKDMLSKGKKNLTPDSADTKTVSAK